ncbi:dimethylamine monooxygenase subunit DmmA family protein [Bacillus sp. FJAT-52991]|uniref:Dimethylamine monooxygenase subunit DmmA family protein n=1 Tax=Bacillus kandeliae TaxID=3129297 RepID=A0ABZ2N582_9BACI
MYNSPVLFDQSETITNQFSLHPVRRNHLIIFEQQSAKDISHLINYMKLEDIEHELYEIHESTHLEDLQAILNRQKMGTQLYIASQWDQAVAIFTAAEAAGFTEDEIQTVINGPKRRYVYCMKCYQLSEIGDEQEAQCSHCQAMMEVGPFFSKVRKGYIGYPFKPSGKETVENL